MAGTDEVPVSDHLKRIPARVRPIVEAARRVVKTVAPRAQEISYHSKSPASASMMWKIARYAVEGANVVGIGTYPGYSTIFFYRGRELDGASGLLAGRGKEMRFITLRAPADADRPAVRKLLRRAFKLGGAAPSPRG